MHVPGMIVNLDFIDMHSSSNDQSYIHCWLWITNNGKSIIIMLLLFDVFVSALWVCGNWMYKTSPLWRNGVTYSRERAVSSWFGCHENLALWKEGVITNTINMHDLVLKWRCQQLCNVVLLWKHPFLIVPPPKYKQEVHTLYLSLLEHSYSRTQHAH